MALHFEGSEPPATPETVDFLARAVLHFASPRARRVLDLGCGQGALVAQLAQRGFDAWGCDFSSVLGEGTNLRAIDANPYRLPFADETFDAVVTTSVLEHVIDKRSCFAEVHRLLLPGGVALHVYPPKWYLPTEPHMRIPFASWIWPRRPRAWYALWAHLGIRNVFQRDMSASQTLERNLEYARDSVSYWSNERYRRLSVEMFGNASWPMDYFVRFSPGGVARLGRRLHLQRAVGTIARETRVAFLLQRKVP